MTQDVPYERSLDSKARLSLGAVDGPRTGNFAAKF